MSNQRNYTLPPKAQQESLRATYERNVAAKKPPYARARIATREAFYWVCDERNWMSDAGQERAIANFSYANMQGIDLTDAFYLLWQIDFSHANLSLARLAHLAIEWPNMRYTNLAKADLTHVSFPSIKLFGAELRDTSLTHARIDGADLQTANLMGADLTDAYISLSICNGADFRYANLTDISWKGANLVKAKLFGATSNDPALQALIDQADP